MNDGRYVMMSVSGSRGGVIIYMGVSRKRQATYYYGYATKCVSLASVKRAQRAQLALLNRL